MKVQIIVEQASDGKFWCYTEQGIGDVGLSAIGDSVAAAKADLMSATRKLGRMLRRTARRFLRWSLNISTTFSRSSITSRSSMSRTSQRERASTHRLCGNIAAVSKKLERRHTSDSALA